MSNAYKDWLADQEEEAYRFQIINNALFECYLNESISKDDYTKAKLFVSVFNDLYQEVFTLRRKLEELQ
jgi:hypothetical protein